jgi:hypothetical protein
MCGEDDALIRLIPVVLLFVWGKKMRALLRYASLCACLICLNCFESDGTTDSPFLRITALRVLQFVAKESRPLRFTPNAIMVVDTGSVHQVPGQYTVVCSPTIVQKERMNVSAAIREMIDEGKYKESKSIKRLLGKNKYVVYINLYCLTDKGCRVDWHISNDIDGKSNSMSRDFFARISSGVVVECGEYHLDESNQPFCVKWKQSS